MYIIIDSIQNTSIWHMNKCLLFQFIYIYIYMEISVDFIWLLLKTIGVEIFSEIASKFYKRLQRTH